VLVGGVKGVERHAGQAGQRCGGDNGPAAALVAQRVEDRVGAEDDAVEVDPHGARRYLARSKSSPIPQPVVTPALRKARSTPPASSLVRFTIAAVGVEVGHIDGDEVAAELAGEPGAAVLVEVRHDHDGAGLG